MERDRKERKKDIREGSGLSTLQGSNPHTLVEKAILPSFVQEMENAVNLFWPGGAMESTDYGRIVNRRHFARLKKMLDVSGGKIIIGRRVDEAERFIEPTMVLVSDENDSM